VQGGDTPGRGALPSASNREAKTMKRTYTVILTKEPEGGYAVIVPALPGCFTEGETIPEARAMAQEAIECYVESLLQHGESVPEDGPILSFDRGDVTEGFLFRVTASPEVPVHV